MYVNIKFLVEASFAEAVVWVTARVGFVSHGNVVVMEEFRD